jgi:hypothetical protein
LAEQKKPEMFIFSTSPTWIFELYSSAFHDVPVKGTVQFLPPDMSFDPAILLPSGQFLCFDFYMEFPHLSLKCCILPILVTFNAKVIAFYAKLVACDLVFAI